VKPKKVVFRPGDRVRIVNPIVVIRCGYPKSVKDYVETAKLKNKDALDALLKPYYPLHHTIRSKIENDLAYLEARGDKFGGRQRTLHTEVVESLRGTEGWVEKVRTVLTGTYYPPRRGSDYYGEDDEPGGLAHSVPHRLASLGTFAWLPQAKPTPLRAKLTPLRAALVAVEIEVCNLEKL
jgi:hypothetical protein